jgi:hypothetical protein
MRRIEKKGMANKSDPIMHQSNGYLLMAYLPFSHDFLPFSHGFLPFSHGFLPESSCHKTGSGCRSPKFTVCKKGTFM